VRADWVEQAPQQATNALLKGLIRGAASGADKPEETRWRSPRMLSSGAYFNTPVFRVDRPSSPVKLGADLKTSNDPSLSALLEQRSRCDFLPLQESPSISGSW